ncbi:MAG: hypothetical protein ABDH23_06965 [Endomicrobiia bacterium]
MHVNFNYRGLIFLFLICVSYSFSLIKNPSFEEDNASGVVPVSWKIPGWSFYVCTSTEKFSTGSFSLKISSYNVTSSGRNFFIYQDVEVKPFYTYNYGVKVFKYNQLEIPAGIALKSTNLSWNENWQLRSYMSTATFSNNLYWQQLSASTTIPSGITKLKVHLVVKNLTSYANFEVFFDDAYFIKDSTPPGFVSDLIAFIKDNRIFLNWTSPGNDFYTGELLFNSEYIIKYTTSFIETYQMISSTHNANVIISTYAVAALQKQIYEFNEIPKENTTYYFCIWTKDNSDNFSLCSNLAVLYFPVNLPEWLDGSIEVSTGHIRWTIKDNSLIEDEIYISSSTDITSRLSFNLGPLYEKGGIVSWHETGLSPNTIYTRFIEIKTKENSFWSKPYQVCTYSLAPRSIKAECLQENEKILIKLSWDASYAEKYLLLYSTDTYSNEFSTLCVLEAHTTFYIHKEVLHNSRYYYRIYSLNKDNKINYNSFCDIYVYTPPSPPEFFGEAISSCSIKWFWNKNQEVENFKIYCAKTKKLIGEVLPSLTFYIETNLDINTIYERYIVAYNFSEGIKSKTVSVCTLTNPVRDIRIEDVSYDALSIYFDPNGNPDYTKYEILISTDNFYSSFSTYTVMNKILIKNLLSDTTYWIKIRSFNKDNIPADFSSVVSTRTLKIVSPIISQFATRGMYSAYDEFVELWNRLDKEIDISGFKLEYWDGNSWVSKIIISEGTKIKPFSFYLISSSSEYFKTTQADLYHKSYLNLADGEKDKPRGLRILDKSGKEIDKVIYEKDGGTSNELAEGKLTSVSCGSEPNNNSVIRKKDRNGFYVDTDNNYNDFTVSFRDPRNSNFYIYGITSLKVDSTQKEGQVKLSWTVDSLKDQLEYRVKYSTYDFISFNENDSFNLEFTTHSGNIIWYVENLEPSVTYYFAVIFKDINNSWRVWIKSKELNINTSNFVYLQDLPPPPVEKLNITNLNRKIKITWEHPESYDVVKYLVFISTVNFKTIYDANFVSSVSYPLNEVIIYNLENNTTYYFAVLSQDGGFSDKDVLVSTYFKVFCAMPFFNSVYNLKFSYSKNKIYIYWEDDFQEEVMGYNIYRSTDSLNFYLTGFSEKTFYEDYEILPVKEYYYYVCKLDKQNFESEPSEVIKVPIDLLSPRIVFLQNFTPEDILKNLLKLEIKLEDDKVNLGDKQGQIVYIKGKFRAINSNNEKEILIETKKFNSNEFEGYLIFELDNSHRNSGFEYYLEISDGINTLRFPDTGWYRVLSGYKFENINYYVNPYNPDIIFENAKKLEIFDTRGKKIFSKENNNSSIIIWSMKDKNGNFLESGVYIYSIYTFENIRKYGYIVVVK